MYDTIIVGGGAAGLSAAIYSGRYGHKTLVITGDGFEGSTLETWAVENYPGHRKIDGPDLVSVMTDQAKAAGAELTSGNIKKITIEDDHFCVAFDGQSKEAKSIIFATGTIRRMLGLPNEAALKGKGVSYCATCDGPIFRNKVVSVVGGGDSAAKAALILAQYTKKVYIFVREEAMIAEPINQKNIEAAENIEVLANTSISELIETSGLLSGVKLHDGKIIELQGIFVEIGGVPNTESVKQLDLELDKNNYIVVDSTFKTNIPGFFAAGDVTNAFGGFRQIITAAAGGSVAANSAHVYLTKLAK